MKQEHGWWFPDSEQHMNAWLTQQRPGVVLNGRPAYQGKKQIALLNLCRKFRTAIDVGSHIGMWTYNLAPLFQTVRCFEPVQEHRSCFARNIDADNVVIYPLALGAERGMVSIKTGPTSTGDSWVDGAGDIRMETLDSFEFSDVDLIKIDCEGYEENVLRGAQQTLIYCQPVVCVEQKRDMASKFGLKPQGAVDYLKGLGYKVAAEISGDYLMTPTLDAAQC